MLAPSYYERFPRLMFLLHRLGRANYEREMELLDVLCARDRIAVDVGAKIGMYTFRMLRHAAEVIAFEPIPVLSQMIRAVFGARCRVENAALSDETSTAVMRIPFDDKGRPVFGRSTIERANQLATGNIARTDQIRVDIKQLDDYRLTDVGFIKVDVEGHEGAVLRGAEQTLVIARPNLLVEANEAHCPGTVAWMHSWLGEREYDGWFIAGGKLVDIGKFDPDIHPGLGVENFIFVHHTRPEVRRQLSERVAALGKAWHRA